MDTSDAADDLGPAWPAPASRRRYYFSDLPFLALWGEKYLADRASRSRRSSPMPRPARCRRSATSIPFFLGEGQGGSNDDHPHADIRRGQAFLSQVVEARDDEPAVGEDRAGHHLRRVGRLLRPRRAAATARRPARRRTDGPQPGGLPRADVRGLTVRADAAPSRTHVYDHTSILKFVEWRWGLQPLAPRDAAARNIAEALDFAKPDLSVPSVPLVTDPGPHFCGSPDTGMALEESQWLPLRDYVERSGWRHVL